MTAATATLLEREGELATLSGHLAAAIAGEGRIVLVRGEAGIGKSALVRTFTELADGSARPLRGACDPVGTPAPLGPVLDVVDDLGPDGRRDVEEALHGGGTLAVFAALLHELRASARPTLLVVEDLHWADGATLDLLRYLGRRITELPVLVLGTYRDDEVGRTHPLTTLLGDLAGRPTMHRVRVEPLSPAAVARLTDGTALDPVALHRITGGNPFFVTEVVAVGSTEVPASVSELVLGRLARMPRTARAVAEAVAVIGTSAEPPLVEALVPEAGRDPWAVLDHGLLHEVGDGIGFRHELVRLALLGSMAGYQRSALHRRVLDELRKAPDRTERLAHLAHHAEQAGDAAAVLEFATAAGARAAALRAHGEAAAQYARALRHAHAGPPGERARLLERHGREAYLAADTDAAIASLRAAVGIRRRLGDGLRLGDDLRLLAHVLRPVGRLAESRAAAAEAERELEALPPGRELAELYLHQCLERSYRADVAGTERYARLACALAERLDDAGVRIEAEYYRARARVARTGHGWAEVTRALEAAAVHLPERAGFLFMTASAVAALHCDPRGAAVMRRAEEYCAAGELLTFRLATRAHGLLHPLHRGRWTEAVEAAGEIVAHPRAAPIVRAPALATLGLVRARRGDPESAAPLDEAVGLIEPGLVVHMCPVWEARAEAAWLTGEDARAAGEALRGLAELGEGGDPWLRGRLARWVRLAGREPPPGPVAAPYALELAGDWPGAARAWDDLGCPYDAALARLSGDAEAVLRALEAFEALGARPVAHRARARLRELGIRSGVRGPRAATRANPHGLTGRQREILELVGDGLTDTQVAARLHLSAKTVNHHVTASLAKLGVHSRVEAVRVLRGAAAVPPQRSDYRR